MLSSLIGDLTSDEFLHKSFGYEIVEGYLNPRKISFDLAEILDWAICRGTLYYPAARLVQDGVEIPTEYYLGWRQIGPITMVNVLVSGAVVRCIRSGASLVVTHAQRLFPELDRISAELSVELSRYVRANIYATPLDSAALGMHSDCHDVFVWQIRGRKRWRVGEPAGFTERILKPGDVLYIPKGTLHQAFAETTGSIHVTLGLSELPYTVCTNGSNLREITKFPLVQRVDDTDTILQQGTLIDALTMCKCHHSLTDAS